LANAISSFRQHERHVDDVRDRREILLQVERHFRLEHDIRCIGSGGKQQRVTVRRRFGDEV
jgi:predicted ABC-type transport system involved in lysophospholipase L1 biosynthesis ATPase subunit